MLCTKLTTLDKLCIKQNDPNVSKLRNKTLASKNQSNHRLMCKIHTCANTYRENIKGWHEQTKIFQVRSKTRGPGNTASALRWACSSALLFFIGFFFGWLHVFVRAISSPLCGRDRDVFLCAITCVFWAETARIQGFSTSKHIQSSSMSAGDTGTPPFSLRVAPFLRITERSPET